MSSSYIGIMSGSSLDGVDLALVSFDKDGYRVAKTGAYEYPKSLASSLKYCTTKSVLEYFQIQQKYTIYIENCVRDFISHDADQVAAIGLHGHTVYHLPSDGFSVQMANAAALAAKLDIPVIHNFRNQDIALGGVGTPLVATFERAYFSDFRYFLNLGGIANLSIKDDDSDMMAFDVCACNQTLNFFAQKMGKAYDESGALASSGVLIPELLKRLNGIEYYNQRHPKSLDNTWVQKDFLGHFDPYIDQPSNCLRTMVDHICEQLARAIKSVGALDTKGQLLVTGGGAFNDFLVKSIREYLSPFSIEVVVPDDELVNYKEAILMAYIAHLRVEKRTNIYSEVTGAQRDTCSGGLYLP